MSTERDLLLRTVAANPDDDTPRLVFADWLQEQDSRADRARADFIRASIAIHRGEVPTCSRITSDNVTSEGLVSAVKRCRCPWCKLARRSWMASRSHAGYWRDEALQPIEEARFQRVARAVAANELRPGFFDSEVRVDLLFRRGFVERLTLSPHDFFAHADGLFSRSPLAEVRWKGHAPSVHSDGRFQWRDSGPYAPNQPIGRNNLPTSIFELLPNAERIEHGEERLALFDSREDANAALSDACVTWGRAARDLMWAAEDSPAEAA